MTDMQELGYFGPLVLMAVALGASLTAQRRIRQAGESHQRQLTALHKRVLDLEAACCGNFREHPYVAKLRQAGVSGVVLGDVAVPPKQAEDLGPV